MFPWILFWAPQLYFPWSGSVIQDIDPETTWFPATLTARAGNGRIEKRALNDVASYGRQLGLITEVLIEIAGKQPLTARLCLSLPRSCSRQQRTISSGSKKSFPRETCRLSSIRSPRAR